MKTTNENKAIQESYFDSYTDNNYDGPNLTPNFNKEVVVKYLADLKAGSTILDFGCGNGKYGYTENLIENNFKVSFIDISTKSVNSLLNRLNKRNLPFDQLYAGDIANLARKMPENYFDVIFFGDVFHHLTFEETQSILTILKPMLKKDLGVILAIEPNGTCPIWRLMPFYNREFIWEVEKNIKYCTQKHFNSKFKSSGYILEKYIFVRILPIFLIEHFNFFKSLNRLIVGVPILKKLSQYTLIVAKPS